MYSENPNTELEEQEIDFLRVFWSILYQWKKVLLAMVICAAVAVAIKGLLSLVNPVDKEELAAQTTAYETLVANNKQSIATTKDKMETLSETAAEQEEYIENSSYMQIDPYHVPTVTASYFVKTGYEIQPSMTYQNINYTDSVVNAYVSELTSESFLQEISDKTGMELRYLKELISVSNGGSGVLCLNVIAPTSSLANQIMGFLTEEIEKLQPSIAEMVDDHTIVQLTFSSYETVNTDIADAQQEQWDKLLSLRESYTEQQENLEDLQKETFDKPDGTASGIIKSLIKFAIIGALLGACVGAAVVFVQIYMKDTVDSASSVQERDGLCILGAIAAEPEKLKKLSKRDRMLRGKSGRTSTENPEQDCAVTGAFLAELAAEKSPVFVTGQTEPKKITGFVEKLKKAAPALTLVDGGNLLTDPQSVKKLADCKSVVLLEQSKVSLHSRVQKECDMAKGLEKEILGVVVIED